ncbi:MAG: hypothetical protein R6U63_02405 [Longimicrobiales bacterium]
MKILRRALPTLALLALFTACGDTADRPAETEEAAVPGWVDNVAAAANAIQLQPEATDSILAAHGMTRMVFDSLIYEVAADPALTDAYQEARGR